MMPKKWLKNKSISKETLLAM